MVGNLHFRWFENITNSFWYETSKLYRQQKTKNWDQTIDQILNDLKTKIF